MIQENFNIAELINDSACFDLQFRKDVRHKRTGSPTYYRWKAQFVLAISKNKLDVLEKVYLQFNCGKINISKDQARFSVQKIEDIKNIIIPYLDKNQLSGNKKGDFNLWKKAVQILYKNKGVAFLKWRKSDFLQLVEIQKISAKYKEKPKQLKWISNAQELAKTLK